MTQSYNPYGNQEGQPAQADPYTPPASPAYGEQPQPYGAPAYYESTGAPDEVYDQASDGAHRQTGDGATTADGAFSPAYSEQSGPDLLDARPTADPYAAAYSEQPAYAPPAYNPPPAYTSAPTYDPAPTEDESSGAAQKAKDTAATAKDEAANVGQTAADSAQHVAGVAKEQAGNVASQAVGQAKDLLTQSRGEVSDQAATQQKRIAGGLHSLADELHSMGHSSDQPGVASDLARQAADRSHQVASWLEDREPGQVLQELQDFARRKPGTFLLGAAVLGVVGGRFTRGIVAANHDDSAASTPRIPSTPAAAPTYTYDEQAQ